MDIMEIQAHFLNVFSSHIAIVAHTVSVEYGFRRMRPIKDVLVQGYHARKGVPTPRLPQQPQVTLQTRVKPASCPIKLSPDVFWHIVVPTSRNKAASNTIVRIDHTN